MHGSELLNIASYCLGGDNHALGPNSNFVPICTGSRCMHIYLVRYFITYCEETGCNDHHH